MVKATYVLEIDWDNNGSFETDVSANLMSATIYRGFASPIARYATVGRASFVLLNSSKAYSPPLVANVRPMRPIRLTMTYSSSVVLFYGYIESITPSMGEKGTRRTTLNCVDAMTLMNLYEGPLALLTDTNANAIITAVVATVYTPPATDYEAGQNIFPYSSDRWDPTDKTLNTSAGLIHIEQARASDKILQACTSDWGRFYISKAGAPTFHNRQHESLDTGGTDHTINNTMSNMSYSMAATPIYNTVEVTCFPRTIGETLEVLGKIGQDSAPIVPANDGVDDGTLTFTIYFRDPSNNSERLGGKSVTEPAETTDWISALDESGTLPEIGTLAISSTIYGDHIELTFTNDQAYPMYLSKCQVRGYAVRAKEPLVITSSDSTSITAYGKRVLSINAPLMNQQIDAQMLADHLVAQYKDPHHDVRGLMFYANRDATMMGIARDIKIGDQIAVTEPQIGLSAEALFVYAIAHNISRNGYLHTVSISLEDAYNVGGTPFRLDTSALNSGHILVY